MHHSTKTSRLANLVLALGLTIVTQLHSLGPDQAARVAPRASPLVAPCTQPSATALALAIDAEAVASATQPAACDRSSAKHNQTDMRGAGPASSTDAGLFVIQRMGWPANWGSVDYDVILGRAACAQETYQRTIARTPGGYYAIGGRHRRHENPSGGLLA